MVLAKAIDDNQTICQNHNGTPKNVRKTNFGVFLYI